MRRMGIVRSRRRCRWPWRASWGCRRRRPRPAGVKAVRVAGGLQSPVGFTFLPDGRVAYLERDTGWLRFRNLQTGVDTRVHRISNVNSGGERGALGVALHPGGRSDGSCTSS